MPPGTAAIVPKKKKKSASPKFTVDEQWNKCFEQYQNIVSA